MAELNLTDLDTKIEWKDGDPKPVVTVTHRPTGVQATDRSTCCELLNRSRAICALAHVLRGEQQVKQDLWEQLRLSQVRRAYNPGTYGQTAV
jgi:hypothetical protein